MTDVSFLLCVGEVARNFELGHVDVEDGQIVMEIAEDQTVGTRVRDRFHIQRLECYQNSTRIPPVALSNVHSLPSVSINSNPFQSISIHFNPFQSISITFNQYQSMHRYSSSSSSFFFLSSIIIAVVIIFIIYFFFFFFFFFFFCNLKSGGWLLDLDRNS